MENHSLPPPEYLLSPEGHDALISLLLDKEQVLRTLRAGDFGPRVTDEQTAGRLLSKVSERTRKVLGLSHERFPEPELVLLHNLSKLTRQTLRSYLFFVPICMILVLALVAQGPETSLAYYVVFSTIALLLVIPLLVHRRTRIHLEHQCYYVRSGDGKGTIVVDELHSVPFQSYLAHEYAHHLLFCLDGETKDPRIREGWARLVQWRVVSNLSEKEGNTAFLYHTLLQIVSELKFVCTMIARFRHKKVPRKIRRIRSIYHFNPLYKLVTGTPGVHLEKLLEHACGTALFLLLSRHTQGPLGCPKPSTANGGAGEVPLSRGEEIADHCPVSSSARGNPGPPDQVRDDWLSREACPGKLE